MQNLLVDEDVTEIGQDLILVGSNMTGDALLPSILMVVKVQSDDGYLYVQIPDYYNIHHIGLVKVASGQSAQQAAEDWMKKQFKHEGRLQ